MVDSALVIFFSLLLLAQTPEPASAVCPEAVTTFDMVECGKRELAQAEAELERYYHEALRLLGKGAPSHAALVESQASWRTARDSFAKAVYEQYTPGTMASPALLGWSIGLTRQRTHDLWDAFIRTQVSDLPEPTR